MTSLGQMRCAHQFMHAALKAWHSDQEVHFLCKPVMLCDKSYRLLCFCLVLIADRLQCLHTHHTCNTTN